MAPDQRALIRPQRSNPRFALEHPKLEAHQSQSLTPRQRELPLKFSLCRPLSVLPGVLVAEGRPALARIVR